MLDLQYCQTIFNEDHTEIRCRRVLDEISPIIKDLLEQFAARIGVSLSSELYIRSYDSTLSTTYADARNPNYAERKKVSDIGRKYYVGLYRKVDDKEYNQITLELNGINGLMLIHTELDLNPFWAWYRNGNFNEVIRSIPGDCRVFTGWKGKESFEHEQVIDFIKQSIKQRKRPWFQVGKSFPLEGNLEEGEIIDKLVHVWESLGMFRSHLNEEIECSRKAYAALMDLAATRNLTGTELLGKTYSVELSFAEAYKSNVKRQLLYIKDGDQMVTKGFLYYFDYHEKYSPFQTIMVQLEGHNHIFTSAREILGKGLKEWWVSKSFSTHQLNNEEVMRNAMELLSNHGIETRGNHYFVGTFDNETGSFVEGPEKIKKNIIDAALIFAYASKKLELSLTEDNGEDLQEPELTDDMEPNFSFEDIYQTIVNSHFTFSKDIIRDLHLNLTALDDKHFVLISGISGTGKTQLCRLYANAVYGLEYESENPYFTIIPVRPDWTDASALFGYYSSFEKRYVKTEFLNVILNALKEREKPHFILLDEMNLARVEYYLSDYLSAVESRKEIPLHHDDQIADIPKRLIIPPNVYLLGTINVDETTHAISDKVLDRAFVMTLSDVDFDTYWNRVDIDLKQTLQDEFNLLQTLHGTLSGYDLHFGYRTMGEMLSKLYANYQLPEEHQIEPLKALDRVISEKVLAKIRGDERIAPMLRTLELWLQENVGADSVSLLHVNRMLEELEYYGATQFWR